MPGAGADPNTPGKFNFWEALGVSYYTPRFGPFQLEAGARLAFIGRAERVLTSPHGCGAGNRDDAHCNEYIKQSLKTLDTIFFPSFKGNTGVVSFLAGAVMLKGVGFRLELAQLNSAGARVNARMDTGVEVSWVPATTAVSDNVRSTFLLAVAEFRPWRNHGFFLKGGMGMAFVRNFPFDGDGVLPPITSKALGLTYGAGWTFRHHQRVGWQIFGAQHVAALGDFQTGGVPVENVIGNFWSAGAAIVIR